MDAVVEDGVVTKAASFWLDGFGSLDTCSKDVELVGQNECKSLLN